MNRLEQVDPDIAKAIRDETVRQSRNLELIASENFVSEAVLEAVAVGKVDRGVLVCGTGIGMAIAANKVAGVRAALCGDAYTARVSREHNDANVLTLAGRMIDSDTGQEMLRVWLETAFAGGRHAKRVDKIADMEGRRGGREGAA